MEILKKILRRAAIVVLALLLLATVAGVVANHLGARALEDEVAKVRAAGGTLDVEALAPARIPPEENAARLYKAAIALYLPPPEALRDAAEDASAGKLIDLKDDAALRGFVESNREALDLVDRGARYARARYDLPYSNGFEMEFPSLPGVHALGNLLALEARFALSDGDVERAFRCVATGLHLADSLLEERTILSRLVLIAIQKRMLSVLGPALEKARPSEATAFAIRTALARFEESDPRRPFLMERAWGYRFAATGYIARGEIGVSRLRDQVIDFVYMHAVAKAEVAELMRHYDEFLAALARPTQEWPAEWPEGPFPWYASRAGSEFRTLGRIAQKELAARAAAALARAALGDAAALDPFTGEPLRRNAAGHLYSLGPNRKDDGGKKDTDDISWPLRDPAPPG